MKQRVNLIADITLRDIGYLFYNFMPLPVVPQKDIRPLVWTGGINPRNLDIKSVFEIPIDHMLQIKKPYRVCAAKFFAQLQQVPRRLLYFHFIHPPFTLILSQRRGGDKPE